MRHPLRNILLFVGLLAVGIGATAPSLQRPDLASAIFPFVSLAPVARVASPLTGTTVDLANYAQVMVVIPQGYAVNAAGTIAQAVLQDSAAADLAWNLIDSVTIDTVDNHVQKLAYRGAKRFVRMLFRAGSANDTAIVSAVFLLSGARFRN